MQESPAQSKHMKEFILAQKGIFIYMTLFFSLLGGALGLPIPEDLPLIAGGIAIHEALGNPLLVFIVCYTAIILGDLIIFFAGRTFGPKIFETAWFKRPKARRTIRKVRVGLERKSLVMIFIARHLFYLRTITFLTCGAVRMRVYRFILADATAALISVPLMLSLGYYAAKKYDTVIMWIHRFEKLSIVIAAIIVILLTIYYIRSRRANQDESEDDTSLNKESTPEHSTGN